MLSLNKNESLKVLGIMSGTSLDALDFALCSFEQKADKYRYKILQTASYPLSDTWRAQLTKAKDLSAEAFLKLENAYSGLYVNKIKDFLAKGQSCDLISLHGQTIFHQPSESFTYQMLNPGMVHVQTGIPLVADFRRENVAAGGQGAPLVPIGDDLLFSEYASCLNLGGFANVSYRESENRIAFDIVFCNRVLNYLSRKLEKEFDENGGLARSGIVHEPLLEQLNSLSFYKDIKAKSLGEEFLLNEIYPHLENQDLSPADLLRTAVEHIAIQIGNVLPEGKCLISGGGGRNQFLIDRIQAHSKAELIIAEAELLEFKEALIFSFLGYLRVNKQLNTYASSTGTENDMMVGAVYGY